VGRPDSLSEHYGPKKERKSSFIVASTGDFLGVIENIGLSHMPV
jgi:hypothetical protein